MTRAHLGALLEPVDRAVELVEMQELVEAPYTALRHLARIVDVQTINGRVESAAARPVKPSKYWTPSSSNACSNSVS
jgi:hypothetical protein